MSSTNETTPYICEWCGERFTRPHSQNKPQLFCSRSCALDHQYANLEKKRDSRLVKADIRRFVLQCIDNQFLADMQKIITYTRNKFRALIYGALGIISFWMIYLLLAGSPIIRHLQSNSTYFNHFVTGTVSRFLINSIIIVIVLKLVFSTKQAIWWIIGTQFPNFQSSENNRLDITENIVNTAEKKGMIFFSTGIIIAHTLPITEIYIHAVGSAYWERSYPDFLNTELVIEFLSGMPVFSDATTTVPFLLAITHPAQYLIVGIPLVLISGGLWNLAFVYEHNDILRDSNPNWIYSRVSIYIIQILIGFITVIFISHIVFQSK